MVSAPSLRTGRTTTVLVSVLAVLLMLVLGVGQFVGLSAGVKMTLMESLALLIGGAALLSEIFLEGSRTGVFSRDEFTGLDVFGAIAGVGVLLTGVLGLAGMLMETTLAAMPPMMKAVVFLFNAVLLARELFTE